MQMESSEGGPEPWLKTWQGSDVSGGPVVKTVHSQWRGNGFDPQVAQQVEKSPAGDLGSIPESERSPGEENGNPLQYSFLEHPMDMGAWRATVSGVIKSQTQLK